MSDTATLSPASLGNAPYDVERVRQDFPILTRLVHERKGRPGKPLVYLDNGASAQKPRQVIDAMSHLLEHDYANVHRGVHFLSQRATDLYEGTRDKVAAFLNAPSRENIVFTRNATEAFNLLAQSWGRRFLKAGDAVLISWMEHHANIVPWQLLRDQIGIEIKVVPVLDDGSLDMSAYAALLTDNVKLVSITHASNVLGTVNPAKRIAQLAHAKGIPVAFDGSQAAVHMPVDVQAIDADFYVFTGHKLYGPTGIGVLYGKMEHLNAMPPWQGGGDMISTVSFAHTTYREAPYRFEAGTPAIVEGIGLGAAIDYVTALGMDAIHAHEQRLLAYATGRLSEIEGVRIIGTAPDKAAIISFTMDGIHPHDIGTLLDSRGVAVRVGRHCAEPLMDRFGVGATARASFAAYNTEAEVDALVDAVLATKSFFG
ncbi:MULTISPECIES: cysteine desulfurase [unclassified Azospirillum]|uniref:cysteine desulfurase n=1 Tax=unclassified Azospirillum TaxID=2630922 RepID=UPI000B6D950D|nr:MULTISPECIES: cysteine desulfurase [unclassified Azospirillum]SNR85507.1 cysteine desulfurase / selenocysteine lyase [Azospirillum sp. RU38E]SNS01450.1 cysteine desulfurase / selenocysteine lyase [Azospirillum sp. RU37A]